MILSAYGEIVKSEIEKIPQYHKRVILNTWVVIPNHIHFIISLGDNDFDNGVSMIGRGDDGRGRGIGDGRDDGRDGCRDGAEKIHEFSLPKKPTIDDIKQYRKQRRKMLIPKIVGKFKQQTSKQINILRNTPKTKNWQANYHDHIIRNERAYQNISNYIINNPVKWEADKFNPKNPNSDK